MPAQTWEDVLPVILQHMIGDTGSTKQYSNDSLEKLICVAGVFVCRDVTLTTSYTINVSTPSISPDPFTLDDKDFMALICLKAAQLIADGEYRKAAQTALVHRDGPSTMDTKGIADNLKVIAKDKAKEYDDAVVSFKLHDGSPGVSIIGPYSAFMSSGDTASMFTGE